MLSPGSVSQSVCGPHCRTSSMITLKFAMSALHLCSKRVHVPSSGLGGASPCAPAGLLVPLLAFAHSLRVCWCLSPAADSQDDTATSICSAHSRVPVGSRAESARCDGGVGKWKKISPLLAKFRYTCFWPNARFHKQPNCSKFGDVIVGHRPKK